MTPEVRISSDTNTYKFKYRGFITDCSTVVKLMPTAWVSIRRIELQEKHQKQPFYLFKFNIRFAKQ